MPKQAVGLYFSCTGTTQKYIDTMLEATGLPAKKVDLTPAGSAPKMEFTADDLVLFGFPVYAGRLPDVLPERLRGLRGSNTPAVLTAVYGNRHYDDSLLELSDLLTEQGFVPIAGAAVVARHTYGEVAVDRPNVTDLEQAEEFIGQVMEKTDLSPLTLPGSRPYRKGGRGKLFKPETNSRCIHCGICALRCPVGAISPDGTAVNDSCISCFRCIRECPMNAKVITGEEYRTFAEGLTKKLEEPRENEFFL